VLSLQGKCTGPQNIPFRGLSSAMVKLKSERRWGTSLQTKNRLFGPKRLLDVWLQNGLFDLRFGWPA
jgi:hypothetical protein